MIGESEVVVDLSDGAAAATRGEPMSVSAVRAISTAQHVFSRGEHSPGDVPEVDVPADAVGRAGTTDWSVAGSRRPRNQFRDALDDGLLFADSRRVGSARADR